MTPDTLRDICGDFLLLSAAHHLALAAISAILWIRKSSVEKTLGVYFVVAFATAALAMWTRGATRVGSVAAGALAALWLWDLSRPKNVFAFRRTPRLRLWLMAAAGLFGFLYPGYTEGVPVGLFSPLGVLLPPTVLIALAFLNCGSPTTNRPLHWSLCAAGAAHSVAGLAVGAGIGDFVLLGTSLYGVALLIGKGKRIEERSERTYGSVQELRERMYSRRTLLPGPRDPKKTLRIGRRRRRF